MQNRFQSGLGRPLQRDNVSNLNFIGFATPDSRWPPSSSRPPHFLPPPTALLRAGPGGCAAMIVAWERLPNGKFGPIQRDGGVRLGDILLRLNTVDLHQRKFEDVMTMLRNPGILNKRLTFVSKEKYTSILSNNTNSSLMRGKSPTNPNRRSDNGSRGNRSPTSNINSSQRKTFMSVIRKARINQEVPSSPFAEYEVSCSLKVSSKKVETQRVIRWSVWKRYSEFER